MATTKKTSKKVAPRASTKAAAVKKPTAKKATNKKASSKNVEMRSFRVSPEERAFLDIQVTRQTIYWIILAAFIVFVQLWILQLHIEVVNILDAQQQQLLSQ